MENGIFWPVWLNRLTGNPDRGIRTIRFLWLFWIFCLFCFEEKVNVFTLESEYEYYKKASTEGSEKAKMANQIKELL